MIFCSDMDQDFDLKPIYYKISQTNTNIPDDDDILTDTSDDIEFILTKKTSEDIEWIPQYVEQSSPACKIASKVDKINTEPTIPHDVEISTSFSKTLCASPCHALETTEIECGKMSEEVQSEDSGTVFKDLPAKQVSITIEGDGNKSNNLSSFKMLSADLTSILEKQQFCDAIIVTKEENFSVHRAILSGRSSKFAKMFLDKQDKMEFTIHDVRAPVMKQLIYYIYSGEMKNNLPPEIYLELFFSAAQYCLPDLKLQCGSFLLNHFDVSNICEIVSYAHIYQDQELFVAAKEFISKNIPQVLTSDGWIGLVQNNSCLAFEIAQTLTGQSDVRI